MDQRRYPAPRQGLLVARAFVEFASISLGFACFVAASKVDGDLGLTMMSLGVGLCGVSVLSCIHHRKAVVAERCGMATAAEILERVEQKCPASCEAGRSDELCAVCLEGLEPGQLQRRLHCGHAFHQSCVDAWFVRSGPAAEVLRCPMCRREALGGAESDSSA
mmetsp:Transcript_60174/g.174300  ORF Transcript_60174/g.174300 Transcript_60174/m.174300 type:complete len:163 (-) Transcript_60174:231-719(-)